MRTLKRATRTLGLAAAVAATVLLVTWMFVFGTDDAESLQPLPLAETAYVLGDDITTYRRFMMSGGPPPDGIPSIDAPRFVSAAEARLDPDDMVIGYYRGGEARAYPHVTIPSRMV